MESSKIEDLSFLTENLSELKEKIQTASNQRANTDETVTLVAVSKTKPAEYIEHLFKHGQTTFGENYVDEYCEKQTILDKNIRWHFIGHLQSNKVAKLIESNLYILETLDSEKLAEKIDRAIKSRNLPPLKVFIQVKMSEEDTKHGIEGLENVIKLAKRVQVEFTSLELSGLMCIGQSGDLSVFSELKDIRSQVAKELSVDENTLQLSTGMSADFEEAVSSSKFKYLF